jgi:hypothetical protein
MNRPLESDPIDFETGEVLVRRSLPQNARMHAMIRDISRQVPYAGSLHDEKWWKPMLLGAHGGQDVVPHPFDPHAAPIVVNRKHSSGLGKTGDGSMADFITQIQAFGDERGVKWSNGQ